MAPAAASLAAAPLLLISTSTLLGLPLVRGDPCTDAAAAASQECCEGTGAYACFTTTRSYAEMCSIPECTAALEAGDEACEVSGEDQNPAKQAYNAMRQLVTCEGLDEECYGTVGDAMNTCQISSALDTDPAAWATVAQTVCLEPNCVEAMTQQVEQCGQARDPGTFLQVQMFEQLLGLCAQGQAAAGQVNAMRCSEEQLRTLSSACYADKGHTQMRCEDCLPIVSQLATVCPVSFTDGEPLAFATACSGAHPRQPKFCTRAPIR